MSLIVSASGIRGTIGGKAGENLTPLDIVRFCAAYASYLQVTNPRPLIYIGRDARVSGELVLGLVSHTLVAMGVNVIDIGLVPTPTVGIYTAQNPQAHGGIILTASHNPYQWNALKLLNAKGEFLSAEIVEQILTIYTNNDFTFAEVDDLGKIQKDDAALDYHIQHILSLPIITKDKIEAMNFRVVVDGINSVGTFALPRLLNALGVNTIHVIHDELNGKFAHNPEPLAEHLGYLSYKVKETGAHLGIAVDPDADRLVLVDENGQFFGEEYTIVACADYVLAHTPGAVVGNLSTTRALRDISHQHGARYHTAAVGEAFVVQEMKKWNAVIGGEGNGGVIYPPSHYGRDALVGTALFLSLLAERNLSVSELKATYPEYFMVKKKIELNHSINPNDVLNQLERLVTNGTTNNTDGYKIDFPDGWVHYRKSNTEPILRIYTEAQTAATALKFAENALNHIYQCIENQ